MSSGGHDLGMAIVGVAVGAADGSAGGIVGAALWLALTADLTSRSRSSRGSRSRVTETPAGGLTEPGERLCRGLVGAVSVSIGPRVCLFRGSRWLLQNATPSWLLWWPPCAYSVGELPPPGRCGRLRCPGVNLSVPDCSRARLKSDPSRPGEAPGRLAMGGRAYRLSRPDLLGA